jgi:hypothetical protein
MADCSSAQRTSEPVAEPKRSIYTDAVKSASARHAQLFKEYGPDGALHPRKYNRLTRRLLVGRRRHIRRQAQRPLGLAAHRWLRVPLRRPRVTERRFDARR